MKIFVTGTRGIPGIPGGVETHCEHLYPLIVEQGHQVLLSRRSAYVSEPLNEFKGVELVDIFSPGPKSLEAIVHTFLSILKAKAWGADIVHVHAVGPSLMVPFARLLGMKVVMTNHGPDYARQKWGWAAKLVLKLGEYYGGRFANNVIVISGHIREIVKERCGRESHLVFNGVQIPELKSDDSFLRQHGLEKGGYLFTAARLVPEKGLHDLIEAFEGMETSLKLVIAGDSDHEDDYSRSLKQSAVGNSNIIMPGYVMGENLAQLFSHARLFVLPSYHEGLPIALLEALSYGLQSVVSDIPANREVALDADRYFCCGDVEGMRNSLVMNLEAAWSEEDRASAVSFVRDKYKWNEIANQSLMVYNNTISG